MSSGRKTTAAATPRGIGRSAVAVSTPVMDSAVAALQARRLPRWSPAATSSSATTKRTISGRPTTVSSGPSGPSSGNTIARICAKAMSTSSAVAMTRASCRDR